MHQELNNIFGITTIQNKLLIKMIWHLKTAEADTPREADIGMEHLCSVGKCSIGETCNLIFEVLEPYRITRFQRKIGDVP